ncbi:hypothetical protein LSG31_19750 [Fodinisporobacter ferrooxydans]|uniref:Group II intron maturase-specific domain-containing protein n=1 Tax=Fodinisporobacter ferrooxydans TaxID=2901836 RepID=A0ABY4CIE3_9BACL|nr:hypothetical protein LSG31_19750 [Alicyclobacillaceae bacterium MYW30-H2]
MRQTIRDWYVQLKSDKTLEDLSKMFNPVLRGWVNYYGRFYKSELYSVYRRMNRALMASIKDIESGASERWTGLAGLLRESQRYSCSGRWGF